MLQYYEYGPNEKWYIAEVISEVGVWGGGGGADVLGNLAASFGSSSFKVLLETKDRLSPRELSDTLRQRGPN